MCFRALAVNHLDNRTIEDDNASTALKTTAYWATAFKYHLLPPTPIKNLGLKARVLIAWQVREERVPRLWKKG
jgi:hypothetical protein